MVDWKEAWRPVVDQVGTDLSDGAVTWGADRIERGAIRKYLEPLELNCPLHTDPDVARAHGHADVTAPYTAVQTFALEALWTGEGALFAGADRNAQPASASLRPIIPRGAPDADAFFATEVEVDFIRPVVAGERLGRRGARLLSCTPKETRVGRGAFLTLESEILTEAGEVVARTRTGVYLYSPRGTYAE